MQLSRQTADNYGTIRLAYFGLASNYNALVSANNGNLTGFSQANIDNYLHKAEFEFEKADWKETPQSNSQGDSFIYDLFFKFRQMNAAVRSWRAYWHNQDIICLVYDFQGNEMLFGSANEPLNFAGSKANVQRATDGSFYDVVLSAQMRSPI